jgi:nitrogen fixation/metabolism regulation signal transduction histidine kinase
MNSLRAAVATRGLTAELAPLIDGIESQYIEMRDRLITAAGAGLSLTMVIHEVEKGVAEMVRATEREAPPERLRNLAVHLSELIQGLGSLTRRSSARTESAKALVAQAAFNSDYRLRYHDIEVVNRLDQIDRDFEMRGQRRLLIATIMNLIDNSIYWIENRRPAKKLLCFGTTDRLGGFPTLFVADNGPGFLDDPEVLTQPFVSRRPDGMGLGLHLAAEVMKVHDGDVLFPKPEDLGLPVELDGAVVALRFRKAEWKV